jgi:hypothetical protein
MRNCNGLHCDGCRHGGAGIGAGIGALVLLAGVLELAAHHRTITHTADDVLHAALVVLAVTAVTLAAAAVTAGGVWLARRQHARQMEARRQAAVAPPQVWEVRPPATVGRPAIEARRPMLRMLPVPIERDAEPRREGRR